LEARDLEIDEWRRKYGDLENRLRDMKSDYER
jgi:hypothetical protein